MTVLDHNYPAYIVIWFLLSLVTLWLFRAIPRKMRATDDQQSKNSLFSILIILGIPFLLVSVLGPLLFIIGDKGMGSVYRYIWGGLALIFVVYFLIKQKSRKEDSPDIPGIKKNDYMQKL